MTITGPLARAARALTQYPRALIAEAAGLDEAMLQGFETGEARLDDEALRRLEKALESVGALFLPEDEVGGVGVRLKFSARDVRAINWLEGEGGAYGSDDV